MKRCVMVGFMVALLCCGACGEDPGFKSYSEVEGPRVLAVTSEPPEINPGQAAQLSVLVAGVDDYEVKWSVCGAFFTMFDGASSQYGDGADDQGCAEGGEFTLPLGSGDQVELPGEVSAQLFASLSLAEAILGSALPEGTVEKIRSSVGLPILVEATLTSGNQTVRAVKRVLVSENQRPHANPPPPSFHMEFEGDDMEEDEIGVRREVVFNGGFGCELAGGGRVPLPRAATVELAPVVEGDEEPWLETYDVIDATGQDKQQTERAFYSWFLETSPPWFGGDGGLETPRTKSPLRNNVLFTPSQDACGRLYLVVRDGHGGTSACGVDLQVGQGSCD